MPRVLTVMALALVTGGAACGDEGGGADPPQKGDTAGGDLKLRQQVGQVLMVRFNGPRAPGYVKSLLKAEKATGAILFDDNVGTSADVRRLTGALQAAAGGDALVATDDEGEGVMQVRTPTRLPAQPSLDKGIERLTRVVGGELLDLGVNVNLAPVADIPGLVTGGRAFSGSPTEIARKVADAVRGYQSAGIGSTAKHFPGFGLAGQNTDDAPVTIGASRKELGRGLIPFRAAIEQNVPLVMASHALYPSLDRQRIASQSPTVLKELLREQLGFEGVIVTDSIEANAVTSRSSVAIAAERSIEAGADLILMTGRGSWIRIYPHLLARARRDLGFRAAVAKSAERVRGLKKQISGGIDKNGG